MWSLIFELILKQVNDINESNIFDYSSWGNFISEISFMKGNDALNLLPTSAA